MTCESFGIPPPILTWVKDSTNEILVSESFIQIEEDSTADSSTSILQIYEPADPDESNYTCIAVNNITNVLDTPEQDTAVLYVQG